MSAYHTIKLINPKPVKLELAVELGPAQSQLVLLYNHSIFSRSYWIPLSTAQIEGQKAKKKKLGLSCAKLKFS